MKLPVHAVFSDSLLADAQPPADIQYMPPGRHRINATRAGKPLTLDISVDSATAETLDAFLKKQLAQVEAGSEDRPYFDFNHEDREAAAWPTEFYWAGEDLQTGGVRARLEWSGAGKKAVLERTFRRFSPTFIPDAQGRVVGSTTNMGGLVNRAAFKSIQPLFAKEQDHPAPNSKSTEPMQPLLEALKDLGLVKAAPANADDSAINAAATELKSSIAKLRGDLETAKERSAALQAKLDEQESARLTAIVQEAVSADRLPPADKEAQAFWLDALKRDEAKAAKALQSLPKNPVLDTVTTGSDPKTGVLDKMALHQRKIAELQAANPTAPFESIFAKAQSEAPDLFR